MIVEFNGLPGSGKTAVSDILCKNLNHAGHPSGLYKDMTYGGSKNKIQKLILVLKEISFKELMDLFAVAGSVAHRVDLQQIRRILIAERICIAYRNRKNDNRIFVVDQGIVQAMLSIVHTYGIKDEARFLFYTGKILYRYNCFYIDAVCDETMSLRRIRDRNFCGGSRMNSIKNDDALLRELRKQHRSLTLLRKSLCESKCIDLSMDQAPDENANIIFHYLLNETDDQR